MYRIRILLLLSILVVPASGFAYSYWASYLTDDFDVYLQTMGYNPLHPPRSEFHLGSLYDIDQSGNLDIVCPATETMAESYTGPDSQNIDRLKTGSFSVIGDIADRLSANVGDEYTKRVKLGLKDIRLLQIPASKDGEIQDSLISERACLRAVINRLRLGHYICQVQSSFSAVAVYEVDDSLNTSATAKQTNAGATANTDNVKKALTEAIQAKTNMQTKESGDSVLTGNLVFGVKLEPVCISPMNALFVRTWHKTLSGRAMDFIKQDLIEAMFVRDLFGEEKEAALASR
jgi:hypothetical protein